MDIIIATFAEEKKGAVGESSDLEAYYGITFFKFILKRLLSLLLFDLWATHESENSESPVLLNAPP